MNGWKRLYVLALLVVSIPLLAMWAYSKPSPDQSFFADCEKPYSATQAEARKWLADMTYREWDYESEPRCLRSLQQIESGATFERYYNDWMTNLKVGVIAVTIIFGAILLVGIGVGWVWRGFFPKRSA